MLRLKSSKLVEVNQETTKNDTIHTPTKSKNSSSKVKVQRLELRQIITFG